MTVEIGFVIVILVSALVLFITEKVRADVVAMLVMLALILTRLVTVEQAFMGFASPAVVTVWAVFIISGGLQRSGVADIIAMRILQAAGRNPQRLLLLLMFAAGFMSAFMNNIGAVAILMPAVLSIGRKLDISPSRLLMPLAFAALLGGNITLIGTPPNILATSIMQERGLEPFRFFDFAPTGLIVLAVGMAYMLTLGQRLLPDRKGGSSLSDQYPVRSFLSELTVSTDSELVGKTISDLEVNDRYMVNVIHIDRGKDGIISPMRQPQLKAEDVLLVEGTPEQLVQMQQDLALLPVTDYSAESWHPDDDLDDLHLAEVTLAPNSRHEQMTLGQINFRDAYGLSVLAVRHHGLETTENLRDIPIEFGDTLLVQGPTNTFNRLLNDPNLLVLESADIELRRTNKASTAVAILLAVIAIAASGWLHVAAVMLAGALLIVLSGVLTMDEAYRTIDWKAVFLIAGMLPLGTAMEQTGTARLVANQMVQLTGDYSPLVILAALFIITALLTEVISNAAATVLLVPIAIDIALSLSLNPQTLVMGTVIAASTSFLMPIGHQVNIIIFGAGNYKFFDYTKVGVWLNLLMLITVLITVPLLWPF